MKKSKFQIFKKQKMYFLFLLPATVMIIVFNYMPMAGLVMAFQNFRVVDGFFGSEFAGLENFKRFLSDPDFYRALKNTIGISGLTILIGFPAPIFLAILIDDVGKTFFKRIFQTISYLPHFVSWVIVATLVYRMLDFDSGIINYVLNALGAEQVAFMRNADYFWAILIFTVIWKSIGWNSIIYLAAISGIDPQLYDAAMVDGAGKIKRIRHITIPGIAPTVALMFVLSLGTLFTVNFDAVFNLMNPMVHAKAEVIDTYLYRTGIQMAKYSYATSIGFMQSTISLIIVVVGFKIAKKINDYSII